MGDLKRRVATLERQRGEPGPWCECPGPLRVVWADGTPVTPFCGPWPEEPPEPAPDICPKCGKPIRVIDVVWDDAGLLDDTEYDKERTDNDRA